MVIIWGDRNGRIVRYCQTTEEARNWGPPEEFDSVCEFDAETNPDVLRGLNEDFNAHALKDGVLCRDGRPVTLAPPGKPAQDAAAMDALLARLEADGTLSAAEIRQILRYILRIERSNTAARTVSHG